MKKTMQILQWKNWKITQASLMFGLILAGLSTHPSSAATTDPNPMCAEFLGDQSILGSDGMGVYCQAADVLCGSTGHGLVLTTTYASPSTRKAWIDLKNAVQYNNPAVPAKSLPRGLMEVELFGMTPNNPDGTCIPGAVGSPLDMIPGETYLSSLRIRIWSSNNTIYDLRFGHVNCEAEHSPCPVIVTAGADLNADGFADMWTVEPATADATAILFKGKPNWQVPPGSKIGKFKVPFKLEFARD